MRSILGSLKGRKENLPTVKGLCAMPSGEIPGTPCPSDDHLLQFALGNSTKETLEQFTDHLANCSVCPDRLDQIWNMNLHKAASEPSPLMTSKSQGIKSVLAQTIFENLDLEHLPRSLNPNAYGRLGRFDLMSVIGAGGMGIVFSAIDSRDGSKVALKTMRFYQSKNRSLRERFLREAHAMQDLINPQLVPVLEIGEDSGIPFFVMQLLQGEDCATLIKRSGPLPIPMVVDIARQATAALEAIHAKGLIHRDIKPANIWIHMFEAGKPMVTLLDFGLVCTSEKDSSLTGADAIVGTPAYLSPEQTDGVETKVGPYSDLFSLGCVLYEAVTGCPVFPGGTSLDILRNHIKFKITPPSKLRPDLPPGLERLIMGLLERNPARRTANTSSLTRQLNNPKLLTIPYISRRQAMWAGASIAAAATISAWTWWMTRRKQTPRLFPELVIDVPGAIALATGQSWNDAIRGNALIWADSKGRIYRRLIGGGSTKLWGQVDFPVHQLLVCHEDQNLAVCGKEGQLLFVPWKSELWKPGAQLVTSSRTLVIGSIPVDAPPLFLAIEKDHVSIYNTNESVLLATGPQHPAEITYCLHVPNTTNIILALSSGEGLITEARDIQIYGRYSFSNGKFMAAFHSSRLEMASLDQFGKLSIWNGRTLDMEIMPPKRIFEDESIILNDMFYLGSRKELLIFVTVNQKSFATVILPDSGATVTQLAAQSPLQAGQIDGRIWLLDSDEKWKRYSIAL